MIRRSEITVASDGVTPRAGVYVTVRGPGGSLATLYDGSGSTISNPLISGLDGSFVYNIADNDAGAYTEEYRLSLSASAAAIKAVTLDFSTTGFFTQSGTGASPRPVADVLNERPSLKGFFKVPDSGYYNAFVRAISALNDGTIAGFHIPDGSYPISASLPVITRTGARITGDGKRNSLIKPQGNFDCLTFRSSTPLASGGNGRVADLNISGFGIDYGDVTAPTGGVALTLDRIDRSTIDVEINSCFQGMLVRGGANSRINGRVITGAYSWTSLATGSWIAKFTYYPGTQELPSEFTMTDINWKGSDSNLENCIIVEASDGLFFGGGGHAGFAAYSQLKIVAQPYAWCSIINVQLGTLYFDGNRTSGNLVGDTTGAAVDISGSTLATVNTIDLSSTTIANIAGVGVRSTLSGVRNLKLGSDYLNIGKEHINLTGAVGFSITNATFDNGNTLNGGSAAVKLASCSDGTSSGCRVLSGTNQHPVGFDLTSVVDCTFSGNVTRVTTTDYSFNTGCDRIAFAGNRKAGAAPTVAAATSLAVPRGFAVVTVTGNTAINGINAFNNADEVITLAFTGTPSVSDGGGNINLAGAFTATAGSSLTLRNTGSGWVETARSIV